VGALCFLLGSSGAEGPDGTPHHLLHLFLCQGNSSSTLVSQLSWNSRAGNFVPAAEFESNSSGAVQAVNGLYGCSVGTWFLQIPGAGPPCSPPFADGIGLYMTGRPCLPREGPQHCAPGAGLGKAPFISPADLEKLSGLALLSFIGQERGKLHTEPLA